MGKKQVLGLDPVECSDRDIFHELFHVLGFLNEHQRPDSDNYVNFEWQNIPFANGFGSLDLSRSKTLGMPYDATSIMHFTKNQAADPIGSTTISSKVCNIITESLFRNKKFMLHEMT